MIAIFVFQVFFRSCVLAVIGLDGFMAQLGCTPPWFVGEEAKGLCGEMMEGQDGVDIFGIMDKTSYQVDRRAWAIFNSIRGLARYCVHTTAT